MDLGNGTQVVRLFTSELSHWPFRASCITLNAYLNIWGTFIKLFDILSFPVFFLFHPLLHSISLSFVFLSLLLFLVIDQI